MTTHKQLNTMRNDLKYLLETSKSLPKRSMVDNMDALNATLHDFVDKYGYDSLHNYILSWLRGKASMMTVKDFEGVELTRRAFMDERKSESLNIN